MQTNEVVDDDWGVTGKVYEEVERSGKEVDGRKSEIFAEEVLSRQKWHSSSGRV